MKEDYDEFGHAPYGTYGEPEEEGQSLLDPYREGFPSLAVLGDGLQTAIEQVHEHDRRLIELECFAASRERCSGDRTYEIVESRGAVRNVWIKTLEMLLLAIGITMVTWGVSIAQQLENTRSDIQQLEERVIDIRRDTERRLKSLEVIQEQSSLKCDESVQLLGDRLGPGPVWRQHEQPHAIRWADSEEPQDPPR